jgi:hypothetical protein
MSHSSMDFHRGLYTSAVIGAALALSIGLQVSAQSFTQPSSAPSAGSAFAPLNTSGTGQIKLGGLTVGAGSGVTTGLSVPNGKVEVTTGRVEIGTNSTGATITSAVGLVLFGKQVRIIDGNQAAGKVLTSDANGLASWQTPAAASPTAQMRAGIETGESITHNVSFSSAMPDTTYAATISYQKGATSNSADCMSSLKIISKTTSGFAFTTGDNCSDVLYNWIALDY